MTREEQIKSYMEKLDISREEAIQLIEDDAEDFIGEEGEQLQEKAKEVKRYEKGNSKDSRKPREKKVDEEKKKIIEILNLALTNSGYDSIITNVDRAIDFDCYTVTLTKHRVRK